MPTAADLHYSASVGQAHDRPPVILIHGAGGHSLYWPPQIRRITTHRIFALDLPGHGQSAGIGRHGVEDYVDDVVAFMGAVGLNSAVWVGHSMGGAIALHAAIHKPQCVLGLGILGSGPRLRVDSELLRQASRPASFPAALKSIGERSFSDAADPRLRQLAMQRMAEIRPSVLNGDLEACNEFDVRSRLGDIRVPTLIISGAQDRMAPAHSAELLRTGIRGSVSLVMRDAGHMVMLEEPEATAAALVDFLDSIGYKPGVARS